MFRLVVGLVAIVMLSRSEAIPCTEVIKEVTPCADFLVQDSSNQPSKDCCNGVIDLNKNAKTKPDRVQVCECIKQALANAKYDPNRIPLLPKACGISDLTLPPINKNTDCNK
ncbi:hypothetical protein L6164_004021 [Bauhinia variegata]|uniref:Uncharacterized protein n=1 Tax=Bauhinia variegata TaxID=167791 RepID=A0ACB9Q360_BAUVA|nr:hypothetical protein L6164_004021 [Bauhinia variegata]